MWVWVAGKPENKPILTVTILKERTILIAERFILTFINIYENYPVSADGVTGYPRDCRFLKFDHTSIPL